MSISKMNAFLVYGFSIAWSRKLSFFTNNLTRLITVLLFFFLDKLTNMGEIEGGSYFAFLLVGGAFTGFLSRGMRAIAGNIREQMLIGTIEPILVTATPTLWAILGTSSWLFIESTFQVLAQFLVGTLLGADFSRANWLSVVVITLLSFVSTLCIGIFVASFTLVYKRDDPVHWLANSLLNLFSGVFFPITVLPPGLRVVSYLLPFTFAIRGLRGALIRGSDLAGLTPDLIGLATFSVILLPLSLWSLRVAVDRLKHTGELSHY